MGLEEQKKCIDPKYQRDLNKDLSLPESTFYPKGTICFKDPSASKYLKSLFGFPKILINFYSNLAMDGFN